MKNIMFAALLGIFATPMMAVAQSEPSGVERTADYVSDAALTARVKSALALQSELSAMDIHVESSDSVVTLTGEVEHDAQIDLAERVVTDIDGVKSVHNKLETN